MTQKLNLLFQFKSRRVSIMAEAIVLVIFKSFITFCWEKKEDKKKIAY